MKKKILIFMLVLSSMFILTHVKLNAASYNYDFFLNAVYSSEGLSYKDTIYYSNIFNGSSYDEEANPYFVGKEVNFSTPTDMAVDKTNNQIYLLDGASTDGSDCELTVKINVDGEVQENQKVNIKKNSAIYLLSNELL